MGFNERFLKKLVEHSKNVFGENISKILENQETLDNAINALSLNTIKSLAGPIGQELGTETRNNVLKDYTGEDKLRRLADEFKENMNKHGIYVSYGSTSQESELVVQVDKCIFKQEGLKWSFCNYSRYFLKSYFNAKEIMQECNIKENNYCSFILKEIS